MELPKISIVVTVKNEEENIAALLDSLLKLDYSGELEVIVVDGGSNDKTTEIVSTYPFVKLITTRCNASQGRNIGIKNSSGEIIAFTDGDCVVDRDWIKNIVKHFDKSSEIAAVGGPYSPLTQHEIIAQYLAIYGSMCFPTTSGFASYQHIGTCNVAFRRKVLQKVGGFNERFDVGEDTDLNFRVTSLGYKLYFAEDIKVHCKFRTTLREASKFAFDHGKASSRFNIIHKKYRKLLFPYTRTLLLSLGSLLIVNALIGNFILIGIELLLLPCYYFYKLIRFSSTGACKYQTKMSLKARLAFPLIDFYIRLVESLGSLVELLCALKPERASPG